LWSFDAGEIFRNFQSSMAVGKEPPTHHIQRQRRVDGIARERPPGDREQLKRIDEYSYRRDCAPAGRLIASDHHGAVGSQPRPADGCRQPVPVDWLDRLAGGQLDPQPVKASSRLTSRRKDVNFINIRPE